MIWVPHQLLGLPFNTNVTLECFTEAHPTSLNYWTRDDGHMIHDSKKYRWVFSILVLHQKMTVNVFFRTESFIGTPNYKTHMKLHIFNVQRADVGSYKCVAKNPRWVIFINNVSAFWFIEKISYCSHSVICQSSTY